MQQKEAEPQDIAKLCDTFSANETSCTTASSDGEMNAKVVINENLQQLRERRGTFEVENEEDEQSELTLETYNPLIHKTTHVVNNMNEMQLFELLECMFGVDEDLSASIGSVNKEKAALNINVEETKETSAMEIEVKLLQV